MHTYEALWDEDVLEVPEMDDYRFTSALDVVAWAQQDRTIGWKTWPDVWHLDESGRFRCYLKGSSLDDIRWWAEDPSTLLDSRAEGLRTSGCADRWVIVESRLRCMADGPIVTEADAAAFVKVRSVLAGVGVNLVDDVVFDDERHWWSLWELLNGTTTWER